MECAICGAKGGGLDGVCFSCEGKTRFEMCSECSAYLPHYNLTGGICPRCKRNAQANVAQATT